MTNFNIWWSWNLNHYCYLSITNSINAVQDYAVIRLSTTGTSVFVICGTTYHSMLHITINRPYNLLTRPGVKNIRSVFAIQRLLLLINII